MDPKNTKQECASCKMVQLAEKILKMNLQMMGIKKPGQIKAEVFDQKRCFYEIRSN